MRKNFELLVAQEVKFGRSTSDYHFFSEEHECLYKTSIVSNAVEMFPSLVDKQLTKMSSVFERDKMKERVKHIERCWCVKEKGCTPDEQMLQLLLVTHINREQMATKVAGVSERGAEREREWITFSRRDGD